MCFSYCSRPSTCSCLRVIYSDKIWGNASGWKVPMLAVFSFFLSTPSADVFSRAAAGCDLFTIPFRLEMALSYLHGKPQVMLLSLDRRLSVWAPSREVFQLAHAVRSYLYYVRTAFSALAVGCKAVSLWLLGRANSAQKCARRWQTLGDRDRAQWCAGPGQLRRSLTR